MDDGRIILLVCCYMPNDNMNRAIVNNDFTDTCMDIQNLIETVTHDEVILILTATLILAEILPNQSICSNL